MMKKYFMPMISLLIIIILVFMGCTSTEDGKSGGGGGGNNTQYSEHPAEMLDTTWSLSYNKGGTTYNASLILNSDGSFSYTDKSTGYSTDGVWGMEGDNFRLKFRLDGGTGSVFTGLVNTARTSMSGECIFYDSSKGKFSATKK